MSIYELAILGATSEEKYETLHKKLAELIDEFGLTIGGEISIRRAIDFEQRNIKAASAVVYFCSESAEDVDLLDEILDACIPIIPIVPEGSSFTLVPEIIAGANGLKERAGDPYLVEITTALLECVGLLRAQRRVFVSYRRDESKNAAIQLQNELSSKCFDVFLDTHKIRPGDPFQDVLWSRLCNSDVLVMLDTPGYFESRWTRSEIGRARAKDIHVLRIVWPEHVPNRMLDLSETIYLDPAELVSSDGTIAEQTIDQIILAVEQLRSRSIAARYLSIAGKLKAEVLKVGITLNGIGAYRATGLTLLNGKKAWVYPVVGIPSAELFNDIADKAKTKSGELPPILVYDEVGIGSKWADHLDWLNKHIGAIDTLKVSHAGWELADWGEDL